MLSKLCRWSPSQLILIVNFILQVLVLGLCFLAGGMKFAEQDFDPSESEYLNEYIWFLNNVSSQPRHKYIHLC